jgi:membrane protease subunit HflC
MSRAVIIAIAALVVAFVLVDSSLFTVDQTEQVLVTQFGQPVRVTTQAGLHTKTPFIQTVIPFDKRLLNLELPGEQVILGDQRRLVVDSFTLFRITDPLLYYQSVGPLEDGIRGRLNSIVSASLRRVLAGNKLLEVLSAKREQIMATIRDQVNVEMKGFGVSIEDVRIRRADLPDENTKAILSRMQSERQRVAAQARADGAEAAQRIRADAERDRTVLVAEARATSDRLRGEGEGEAIRISAKAYSQDAGFYATWRTLQAYRDSFETGGSRLVLTPDNDFLRYLRAAPTPAGP